MKFGFSKRHHRLLSAFILLAIVIQLGIPSFRDTLSDDAYVNYVYARNLAEGKGFNYNGKGFSSASTPLWSIILSVPYLLFGGNNLFLASKIIDLILTAITILLVYSLMNKLTKNENIAIIASFLVAVNPWINLFSASAVDTVLFITLSLLSVYLYISKKYNLSALSCGFAFLARPEGGFLFLLLIAHRFFVDTKQMKLSENIKMRIINLVLFLIIVSPWLILTYVNEGSIFSTSFLAKRIAFGTTAMSIGPLKLSYNFILETISMDPIFFSIAILSLAFFINRKELMKNEIVMHLWWIIIIFVHVLLVLSSNAYRYITLFIPFLIISAFLLFDRLKIEKKIIIKFSIIMIIIIASQYLILNGKLNYLNGRLESYFQMAEWINHNIPENKIVGVGELGILKWESNRYLFDITGIINVGISNIYDPQKFVEYLAENGVSYVISPIDFAAENQNDPIVKNRFSKLELEKVVELNNLRWGIYKVPAVLS